MGRPGVLGWGAAVRAARRTVLATFKRVERPAAWVLLIGAGVTFFGVILGLIVVGEARFATLLISADLFLSGLGSVQEAENNQEA